MLQNIIIIAVLLICAWFIGRRIYNNFTGSSKGCGCSCGCSGCGPDVVEKCQSTIADHRSK